MSHDYYVYREARTVDELEALLRLKYSAYRASRLHDFVPDRACGIYLNAYDFRATHFGLFENDVRPVGYQRTVFEAPSPKFDELMEIRAKYPELASVCCAEPREPFYVMSYWPKPSVIRSFYQSVKARGERVAETAGLAVDPAISCAELATHIIEAEGAVKFFVNRMEHLIMGCSLGHSRYYRHYGFRYIRGAESDLVNGLKSSCIVCSIPNIPHEIGEKLFRMADAFIETGGICYNPSEPDNYHVPNRKLQVSIAAAA